MNKKLTVLLYSILIASISSPFIQTTSYISSTLLFICLFVSVLIAFFIKEKKIHYLWIFASSVYIMYMYGNPLSLHFKDWIGYFSSDLSVKMMSFLQRELLLIPQEFGLLATYLIISLSISITAKTKGIWKVYLVCYIVFYMFLSVFLKIQFHESIVTTIGVSLLIGFIENTSTSTTPFNAQRLLIVGILFSILLAGSNYLSIYQSIHLHIIKNTMNLRSTLSAANFYDNFRLSERSSTTSKSGYSNDDSRLGGPLYMDYSEAFSVKESEQTYWRVNSKYVYTGSGWTNRQRVDETDSFILPSQIGKQTLNSQIPITHEILSVYKSIDYIPIPLGYSEYSLNSEISHTVHSNKLLGFYDINALMLDYASNGILNSSTFVTSPPIYTKSILEDVVPSLKTQEFINDQKIDNIPDNIKNLALEITATGNNMYEKVKLIETYLNSNKQLKYSLSDVPYVPEGGNYVEHFLFESQIGYCEHFASAMVVMAQSLGIPARYSKGFSKGTHFDGVTTIKNSDAHAWPEIYFEEYGWIAFEPTPSFSIPTGQQANNQDEEVANSSNSDISIDRPVNEQDDVQINPSSPQEIEEIEKKSNAGVLIMWAFSMSLIFILAMIYKFRVTLKIKYIKFQLDHNKLSFIQSFDKILKVLNVLVPQENSEILSHYAMRHHEDIKLLLIPLIRDYEQIKYSNQPKQALQLYQINLMHKLLKRMKYYKPD